MGRKIEISFGKKRSAKERKKYLAKGLAIGAAAGSAFGALSGILFAPKSGSETRQQIKDDVSTAAKKAAEEVKEASEKAASGIKEATSKANELVNEKLKLKKATCCCDKTAEVEEVSSEAKEYDFEVTPDKEI